MALQAGTLALSGSGLSCLAQAPARSSARQSARLSASRAVQKSRPCLPVAAGSARWFPRVQTRCGAGVAHPGVSP